MENTFFVNDTLELVSYIKNGKGILEEEVKVHFDIQKYAMTETEETRKMIETIWSMKSENNSRLFNQSKYRLAHHCWDEKSKRAEMFLGLTDYKDHMGTNLSENVDKYVSVGSSRFDMMSQCVGVGAWVITADNKVILVESAAWKGEQACKIDRPGGHAEPDESVKLLAEDKKEYKYISDELVRKELFECIQKEVRDEINVSLEHQLNPELLGVIYNLEKGGRLALEFFICLDIDSEKVRDLYNKGGAEADESTNIFFIDVEDVKSEKVDPRIVERFTPHATGSLELLKRRLIAI
eukprot:TRINITY_DN14058_c0_g1_i1.p1 TRINITY_DN14058_c0_g1~~TRINITY_DN14058_c0_g1_i1.p1  ORF type:complete len:295 (-),score=75.55 TRINITY_DN14058_c0_g1_i1:37-921(-)